MEYALAVDLGTGGPKVALVGVDGSIADHEIGRTQLMLGPGGRAEQDPDDWWRQITTAVRRLMARGRVAADKVRVVSVTAQWAGTVAVDINGSHLMNALIWMDTRGARYVDELFGGPIRVSGYGVRTLRRFVSHAGGLPGHSGKDPTAHIQWIRHQCPEVYAETAVFLEPADYLNLRLTGRTCSSYDCIAAHWVTDNRELAAVHYDPGLIGRSRLDRNRLPELVPSATIIGGLLDTVADEWGLRPGTPVATASPDLQSAAVGSGAVANYAGHVYIGTSSWVSCHVPRKRTDLLHYQAALPSALPGRYLVANPQESAGICLDFLKDNLRVRPDGQPATASAQDVYRAYEEAAAHSPAGAGGVIFTPWLNGERTPVDDHTVRGGFHNLSLTTTQSDLIRAVYEGVAFNSRWLMNALERFIGRTLPSLTFIGGGAKSDLWAQILADVLGRPIRQAQQPQLSNARGAAFIGFVALGLADPDDLSGRVTVAAEYVPNPAHRDRYDELFAAFTDVYKRNRGLYAALNRAQ